MGMGVSIREENWLLSSHLLPYAPIAGEIAIDGLFTCFVAAVPMEKFGKSGTQRSTEHSVVKFAVRKTWSVSMANVRTLWKKGVPGF